MGQSGRGSYNGTENVTTAPGGSGITISYRTTNPVVTRTYEQRLGLLPSPVKDTKIEDAVVVGLALLMGYILTRSGSGGAIPGQYSLPSTSPNAVSTRLPTPLSTRFISSTATTATVAVNNVSGAKMYQWYDANTNGLLTSSTSTTAVISGLQPNTDYAVYVVAVGANGATSYPSAQMTINTQQQ